MTETVESTEAEETFKVKFSGRTYVAFLDPKSEFYPSEIGLQEAQFSRLGRGLQYRYSVTRDQLDKLIVFLDTQSARFTTKGVTPLQREEGYSARYDLVRLEKLRAGLSGESA